MMTDDKSDDAKQLDLIRFLRTQKVDPSETYVVREAGGVARVDRPALRTKHGGMRPSRLWPAKDQAIRKLRITIGDLDEALDDLEGALWSTRESLAGLINGLVGELPAGKHTLINHPLRRAGLRDQPAQPQGSAGHRGARHH